MEGVTGKHVITITPRKECLKLRVHGQVACVEARTPGATERNKPRRIDALLRVGAERKSANHLSYYLMLRKYLEFKRAKNGPEKRLRQLHICTRL